MAPMKSARSTEAGSIRIVGGRWRGTRLAVPARPGLRPSSDRVRETLFNWLAPILPGARVVDVFAGTGALGLEAVSRGAVRAVLVERDATLYRSLCETIARLSAQSEVEAVQADSLAWLSRQPRETFDVAFVDPPFDGGLWQSTFAALGPSLSPGARVYVESPVDAVLALPSQWELHRQGATRDVRYALYRTPDDTPLIHSPATLP
ncbi:MAG: 16S rRNA (guanine(966)-N(2))-methyltransferase RsmD [Burkholderiales bacterium]|nr:MAG: 16S rRNA (guanine(966)-N(2))-methyltransferase RsmD [Burkholderiales bacterium]